MNTREQAINWWASLKLSERVIVMNRNNVEPYRSSETLTGNEIEQIWREEVKNPYLDRLKQQYKIYKQNYNNGKTIFKESNIYFAMRLFCLDCELVSFIDVESMEYEVNSELNQSF
jgi:hypothetical protein